MFTEFFRDIVKRFANCFTANYSILWPDARPDSFFRNFSVNVIFVHSIQNVIGTVFALAYGFFVRFLISAFLYNCRR